MQSRRRNRSAVPWALVLLHIALPFCHPFAHAGNHPQQLPRPSVHTLSPTTASATTTRQQSKLMSLRNRITTTIRGKPHDPQRSSFQGEEDAPLVSRLLYNYASPIIRTAADRRLNESDAFVVPESRKMSRIVTSLFQVYQGLQKKHKKKLAEDQLAGKFDSQSRILTRALLLHQRRTLIMTGVLRLLNTSVQAFPALLVAKLLRLVEAGDTQPVRKAVIAAMQLVTVLSLKMVTENLYFHNAVKCSTSVRGSVAGLVFDKSLLLQSGGAGVVHRDKKKKNVGNNISNSTDTPMGAGGVLNLIQSDASILESTALQFHTIWDGPLQIAIYTYLLFSYLGPCVFWGIGVLLATIPTNGIILRVLNRLNKLEIEAKDARTKRTAESISHMKLLKLQGWEKHFADDIRRHRRTELQRHVQRGLVRALSSAISNAVPAIVLVVTLTAYVKTGRPIVASTIFTAISLFNQLRFPLFFYPMLIDSLVNGSNAIRRIATFMNAPEIVPYVKHLPVDSASGGGSIEMTNGNFVWSNANNTSAALANVNIKINPGEVVAVVGSVGSGKSALVKGLLGELSPVPGNVVQHVIESGNSSAHSTITNDAMSGAMVRPAVAAQGEIAYCSQEAWLPKGTIRDAIVFGRPYDEERYMASVRDAGLDDDIISDSNLVRETKSINNGALSHDTDVGEGGSSLSGGQRARVALARALYSDDDTQVFLLDDCLSALDASVGATVFERMTERFRKSKAATLLVSNDPSIPRRCDRVILMGNVPGSTSCSSIIDVGTYDELLSRGHDLRSISISDDPPKTDDSEEDDVESGHIHNTIEVTSLAHADELSADPPHLVKAQKKNPIHVVGGYGAPKNATNCAHADCEPQVTMQNCPDSMANQVLVTVQETTAGSDDNDMEGSISNSTATSAEWTKSTEDATLQNSKSSTNNLKEKSKSSKLSSADDNMAVGAVPISTYVSYFRSVGQPTLVIAMVSAYLMSNGAQFFQQYTVAKWTEVGANAMGDAVSMGYLNSLINAAGVVSVFLWIRSFLTMRVGVKASEYLHSRMLSSVFSAPMAFFDATSSGTLLSRFGKETETVDRSVPDSIGSVLFCFLQIGMSAGALAGIITPGMLLPLTIVGYFYVKMMGRFRPATRDLKRAETRTRSPIYTHFGETLRGSETIRSIRGARGVWSARHQALTDKNLGVFYTVKALDRWLSTRLETLGNTVVFTAAVASVLLTRAGRLKVGSAGWGLTQALAITGLLTWAVRCLTDLESNMMSVMRVQELTDLDSNTVKFRNNSGSVEKVLKMPKELSQPGSAFGSLLSPSHKMKTALAPLESSAIVKNGWPWRGNIQFRGVSMRYNPSAPLVLKDVTLTVPAGTTLGVVGRTGSGKSSLLITLFRLAEIEGGGSIEIDGVDIRSVSMGTLRESLAVIPQDPTLFTGSVRFNLDATGRSNDGDMLRALQVASPELFMQLKNSEGLSTLVSEGGKNFSQGQRQLICLARALVRRTKILVMDEATASIDPVTDQLIQETIRREFVEKGVTVITVAHRLETVLAYDRIAVLGDGNILEYGPPDELTAIPGGEFQKLILADRLNKRKGAKKGQDSLVTA